LEKDRKSGGGNISGVGDNVPAVKLDKSVYSNRKVPVKDYVSLERSHPYSYVALKEAIKFMPKPLAETISKMEMPKERMDSIVDSLERVANGIWSVFPMMCSGDKCCYGTRCGFAKENMAPIGSDCPLESYLIAKWMGDYVISLSINTDDKVQMDQIGTIVMSDIMIMRIRNFMSRKVDGHIDESAVGVDSNGNVILKRDVAKEILIEEKYQKMKSKIQEELLATKESRAKYDVVDEKDASVNAAKLRYRAQELKKKAVDKSDKLVRRAEFLESAVRTVGTMINNDDTLESEFDTNIEYGDDTGDDAPSVHVDRNNDTVV
jgi:hypothetical protein